MYPDWIIHYDPFFKGPEHKVMEEGKEIISEVGLITVD